MRPPTAQRAARRSASRTTDVLVAVIDVYGNDFNQVLRSHGTDRQEVLEPFAPARCLSGPPGGGAA